MLSVSPVFIVYIHSNNFIQQTIARFIFAHFTLLFPITPIKFHWGGYTYNYIAPSTVMQ